jgi:hypothetical protein
MNNDREWDAKSRCFKPRTRSYCITETFRRSIDGLLGVLRYSRPDARHPHFSRGKLHPKTEDALDAAR